jgi:hypothetical protein
MGDAPTEVSVVLADRVECLEQYEHQIVVVARPAVGELGLGELPDALVGVELGRVGWESFEMESLGSSAQLADQPTPMRCCPVPEDDDVAGDLPEELPQKVAGFDLSDVVGVKLEVEIGSLANGRNRDARNRRDSVAPVEVVNRRRLAHGSPGLGHRRGQLEARFVGENDMGAQPAGVFFTLGHSRSTKRRISARLRSSAFLCGF